MNFNLRHPCIMYLNPDRYKKELAFAKILGNINSSIYFDELGIFRIHVYYIHSILNTINEHVKNNNSDCVKLFQILLTGKQMYDKDVFFHERNFKNDRKLNTILTNATSYLNLFNNLKLMDFCINDNTEHISLMRKYMNIIKLIEKGKFPEVINILKEEYAIDE